MNDRMRHWNKVYGERRPDEVSWFQAEPTLSLELIRNTGLDLPTASLIDVGGGASVLVDRLLAAGMARISVLDVSAAALESARKRLGSAHGNVKWIEADVTDFQPNESFDIWHDRAVFHLLADPLDRSKYLSHMGRALSPGGHVIIATFAPDGPEKCSGLPVRRYGMEEIATEFGPGYKLTEQRSENHRTPWDTGQRFNYFRFERA